MSSFAREGTYVLGREPTLHGLMEAWRLRLDPAEFRPIAGFNSCRRHVSQEAIAAAIGVTTTWYGALERGRLDRRYSEDFLEKVAEALRLRGWERRILFHLVLQREPPGAEGAGPTGVGDAAPSVITPAIQSTLDVQPWPAYIVDGSFEILAYNAPVAAWFPDLPAIGNVMRWIFFHPSARQQLTDWNGEVRRHLAQLRAQHALAPCSETLRELIIEILASSAFASRLWQDNPEVRLHEDGYHRTVVRADTGQQLKVEVVSWAPLRESTIRGYGFYPLGWEPEMPMAHAAGAAAR